LFVLVSKTRHPAIAAESHRRNVVRRESSGEELCVLGVGSRVGSLRVKVVALGALGTREALLEGTHPDAESLDGGGYLLKERAHALIGRERNGGLLRRSRKRAARVPVALQAFIGLASPQRQFLRPSRENSPCMTRLFAMLRLRRRRSIGILRPT
jgi:hypothetical protein